MCNVHVCEGVPRIGTVSISANTVGSLLCQFRRVSSALAAYLFHSTLSPFSEAVSLLACSSESEVSDWGVIVDVSVAFAVANQACGRCACRPQCLQTSEVAYLSR